MNLCDVLREYFEKNKTNIIYKERNINNNKNQKKFISTLVNSFSYIKIKNNNINTLNYKGNKKENTISFSINNTIKNIESNSFCDLDPQVGNSTLCPKSEKNDYSNSNIDSLPDVEFENNNIDNENSIKEIKTIKLNKLDYFDLFKCGMKIRYNCNSFFNSIKNKLIISIKNFKESRVIGEGNCFFKCLSKFLYCRIEYDEKLQRSISIFCKDNINEINNYQNKVKLQNGEIMNTTDYINNLQKKSNWATDIDIIISCFIFGINIAIYKYSDDKKNLEYVKSFVYDERNMNNPTMVLINDNLNHFNLIYPYISGNIIIDEKIQFKNDEDENPFPEYLGLDKNLYLNIFKFLNNGIVNGKRTWPDYIEYIQDRKFRDKKKAEFYQKIGVKNECNIHNLEFKKKYFKFENFELIASQDKYIVENNRLYLTRYEYNNIIEKKLLYKKYLIPYKKEIENILNKYHDENSHLGKDETIESIKNNNFYWASITQDVEEYLKNCPICCNKTIEKSEIQIDNV